MFGWEHGYGGFWWIFPIILFILIVGCISMMRGCSWMSGRHFPCVKGRRILGDPAKNNNKRSPK